MLGTSLREARLAAGLNQCELARRLGVPRATVWRTETGRSEPRPKMLADWARVCGVSADSLLASIEDRHAPEIGPVNCGADAEVES